MGQPEFVPVNDRDRARASERPPAPGRWVADRPGDVRAAGGQPAGPWLGSAGPDQGYALRLAALMREQLAVAVGEHLDDVVAGCVEVAMKRSALFGRAPVRADLEVAFSLWGFLGEPAEAELVAYRRGMFAQASHHYAERRAIVDLVPEATLRLTPAQVQARGAGGWRELLTAPAPTA